MSGETNSLLDKIFPWEKFKYALVVWPSYAIASTRLPCGRWEHELIPREEAERQLCDRSEFKAGGRSETAS